MLNVAETSELFKAVKEKPSVKGINDLIRLYVPLVTNLAKKFAKRKEKQDDDYVGEALLALVKAIHTALTTMTHDNIHPYIICCVRYTLQRFYVEDKVVVIKASTLYNWTKQGTMLSIKQHPFDDVCIDVPMDLVNLYLDRLGDPLLKQLVLLKIEGHTEKEIEFLLNIDMLTLRRAKRVLQQFFKEFQTCEN